MLTVAHVRQFVEPLGLQVLELGDDTSTAPLAAAALDTEVGAIAKSLLFFADERPILVVAAGDRRVDRALLAAEMGADRVRLARPAEVGEIAGYAPGGVPPVALAQSVPVRLDRHLLRCAVVYAAAGGPQALFAVPPAQLREITGATLTAATVPLESTGTV